jgi:cytochrome c
MMNRKGLSFVTLLVSATLLSGASSAEFGTTEEARGLLERAVTAVKKDPAAAIRSFNYNAEPFRDRDLFVFCFNGRDGKFTAHEAFVGWDVRTLRDAHGKAFGAEMYSDARDSLVTEVSFESPLPGSTKLAPKRAYVIRIGDQVCGVSAYQFSGESRHTQ